MKSAKAVQLAQTVSEDTRTLLEWTAPEYIKHSKGRVWFVLAGIVLMGLVFYAIYTDSWTMAVAFILLAGVYLLAHHREPVAVQVKITDFDIQIGSRRIPYTQIKAFWILYHPPMVKVLKLLSTDKFMSEINIQLDGQLPGPVRETLLKHIPEYEGKCESFVEILIRAFKL